METQNILQSWFDTHHGVGFKSPSEPRDIAFLNEGIGAANITDAITVPRLGQTTCRNTSVADDIRVLNE